MIFLAVGTEFPFDRLVRAIDQIALRIPSEERILAQIGCGGYRPRCMDWVEMMEKSHFDEMMRGSVAVISHAGIGTIIRALELHKPVLVMPRLRKYGEHVNDHQVSTARKFESLGYVLAAYRTQDLICGMDRLRTFRPRSRRAQTDLVVTYIKSFLDNLCGRVP